MGEPGRLVTPAVLGCGHAVPDQEKDTDDPMYRQVDPEGPAGGEQEMITGAGRRRVLADHESIESFMLDACRTAMAAAKVTPNRIDRLYGYVSVSDYMAPNGLYLLHSALGLRPEAVVVPINSEYSNFPLGVFLAAEAVRAGTCGHALVVTGSNWSRHVDYTRPHAVAIGDGAGAAVVGPGAGLAVVDYACHTDARYFESMTLTIRDRTAPGWSGLPRDPSGVPIPTYAMDPETGPEVLGGVLKDGLPALVTGLLGHHGLDGESIALITHQGSRLLLDHWNDRIRPAQYLETFDEYGNMVTASYPVTLARYFDAITAPYVVIAAAGAGLHLAALLLKNTGRGGGARRPG
ncbi:3-oxoacyl-[acyl-carrier-protein] synthase III C-terminal domain-containing protein [Bailinhaonella thermotolerans]|uniref:3-oxoacyl-ACP synthase n=1 Tax=Bailinhaonella thermotolerans TaxID=1070861 RepID=A0A3A4ACH7_9ACTN|nr:3-oxoacyl-[acyl-carrier-protein] synthase III C-terminal domain-containing protein [Bailinhaonella thermotolerans]RJL23253.1 3-oxoacyl-ACP synthase [Bailinhaonella thermotolerans]